MSSFKRRSLATQPTSSLPGCRPSLYNSVPLTSTGVPSLDDLVGGGVPIGTSLLVAEDVEGSYAKLLLRYWIAQGLLSGQDIVILGSSWDEGGAPEDIVKRLMGTYDEGGSSRMAAKGKHRATDSEDEGGEGGKPRENMKIAWRYEGMKKYSDSFEASRLSQDFPDQAPYCSDLDLTKTLQMTPEMRQRLHMIDVAEHPFEVILKQLENRLRPPEQPTPPRPVRIAIQSFGSLGFREAAEASLFSFVTSLRSLLRSSPSRPTVASAMLTFPTTLHTPGLLRKVQWATDGCVALESFSGNLASQIAFPNHQGIVTLPRVPAPQSLGAPINKTSNLRGGVSSLGFRVGRRRGLRIELMGLGIEGGVNERRTELAPVDLTMTPRDAPALKAEGATKEAREAVSIGRQPRRGGLKKAGPRVRFGGEDLDESIDAAPKADSRNTEW